MTRFCTYGLRRRRGGYQHTFSLLAGPYYDGSFPEHGVSDPDIQVCCIRLPGIATAQELYNTIEHEAIHAALDRVDICDGPDITGDGQERLIDALGRWRSRWL